MVHPAYFWATWILVGAVLFVLVVVVCKCSITKLRKRRQHHTMVFQKDMGKSHTVNNLLCTSPSWRLNLVLVVKTTPTTQKRKTVWTFLFELTD